MKILFAAYECAPFFKKGGLGDVIGSLPIALQKEAIDVAVVMPYYDVVNEAYPQKKIGEIQIVFHGKLATVGIYRGKLPGSRVTIYFLRNKQYMAIVNAAVSKEKYKEFAFFSIAIVELVFWLTETQKWKPDLIHCHDWHTALVPLILKKHLIALPTVLTIHNMSHQGTGSTGLLDMMHVDDQDAKVIKRGERIYELNILGEGIFHSDVVTTVSETYAQEILDSKSEDRIYTYLKRKEEEQGKRFIFQGIMNGIDYTVWDPAKDDLLQAPYTMQTYEVGKLKNKDVLLKKLQLPDRLTFCFIGRLVNQKGIDLISKAMDTIADFDCNIILLGEGEKKTEEAVRLLAKKYPSFVRAEIFYNEPYSHQLFAASDFILIPSHFEPCGLIQMIAMRYGTIPIASKTGGLVDSIQHGKNGFLFENGSVSDFRDVMKKAVHLYQDKKKRHAMITSAMETDFSWKKSAISYRELYTKILGERI